MAQSEYSVVNISEPPQEQQAQPVQPARQPDSYISYSLRQELAKHTYYNIYHFNKCCQLIALMGTIYGISASYVVFESPFLTIWTLMTLGLRHKLYSLRIKLNITSEKLAYDSSYSRLLWLIALERISSILLLKFIMNTITDSPTVIDDIGMRAILCVLVIKLFMPFICHTIIFLRSRCCLSPFDETSSESLLNIITLANQDGQTIIVSHNFKIVNWNDQMISKECSICLTNFIDNEQVKQLVCNHAFHEHCVTPWLTRHPTCPVCRVNVIMIQNN
jgi:E3 ubiquitin-protein ligase ATL23